MPSIVVKLKHIAGKYRWNWHIQVGLRVCVKEPQLVSCFRHDICTFICNCTHCCLFTSTPVHIHAIDLTPTPTTPNIKAAQAFLVINRFFLMFTTYIYNQTYIKKSLKDKVSVSAFFASLCFRPSFSVCGQYN